MRVKVIIEAGSSKTESRLIDVNGKQLHRAITPGINPVSDPSYREALTALCTEYQGGTTVEEMYYYGSGCINTHINDRVKEQLREKLHPAGHIHVHDDLTAAGRASCQHNEGLVCIMGTGSIIGYCDGRNIADKLYSGGHLLGDEGSGYDIGRTLMIQYLRGQLPAEDRGLIAERLAMSNTQFIQELYQKDNPRKYLASFALYLHQVSDETRTLILDAVFTRMITNMISPMNDRYPLPLHFVGSVAFHFQNEIAENLKNFDIIAASFEQSAIEGLVQYHNYE